MKKQMAILPLIWVFCSVCQAQQIAPDFSNLSSFRVVNRNVSPSKEKKGIYLNEKEGEGFTLLPGTLFSEGSIEVDIKGRNKLQRSFTGIIFHVENDSTFEGIYFRPFNFMNSDTARRSRAVQYFYHPQFPWDVLRSRFPGKYENKVSPVPDPDQWFHVRVDVSGEEIKVFVDYSEKPSLTVKSLSKTKTGPIGLWVGTTSDGSFANLQITPKK